MVRGCQKWFISATMGLCALMIIGSLATPAYAQREARIYHDSVNFSGRRLGRGDSTSWNHNSVPASVLNSDSITRAGVIVTAADIDYPPERSCQCDGAEIPCEDDELYVNGQHVGRLEGCNTSRGGSCPADCDQPVSDEMSVSISMVRTDNTVTVSNESSGGWVVTVYGGEFYVYGLEDFDISASPTSQTVNTTDTTTYQIQIDWIGVWDNPVDLSVSGLPAGATADFSSNPVTSDGGTSTLMITLNHVAAGTYPLRITGSGTADYRDSHGGRNVSHHTEVDLIVQGGSAGAFTVTASPNMRGINQGEDAVYDVTTVFNDGWNNPVTLAVTAGLPQGATWAFDNNTVTDSGEIRELTITTAADTPEGTYTITITGTGNGDGGTVVDTTTVQLAIGESGFTLTARPKEIVVELGQTVKSTINAEFFGNCNGPVKLSISKKSMRALPKSIQVKLKTTVLEGGTHTKTQLIATVGPETAVGEYPVIIEGAGCDLDDPRQVTVRLMVKPVNLVITKRQSQSTVMPNMVQIYTIEVKNKGKTDVSGVIVSDILAATLTYVSDTAADAVHSVENGRHVWTFNRVLRPGGSFAFNINARVDPFIRSGASISNQAEVIADQTPEPVLSNTVTAISGFTAVEPRGLQVSKRALKHDARIGGILTYRIEVKNISQAGPIFDIVLSDRMPGGFKIPPGKTARDGSIFSDPSRRGQNYTWQIGNLGPGERTVITYQAVVGTNASSGRNENIATATGRDGGGNRVTGTGSAVVMLGAGDIEELGQITVTVFSDRNRNDILDGADTPMTDVEVLLVPPGLKQTTDENGETVFAYLKSGQYIVAVNELKLAEDVFVSGDTSQLVRLLEGESAEVPFLLYQDPGIGKLIARVFLDSNRNGTFDNQEPLVETFTALLDGQIKSKGKKGRVIFSRLKPGSHTLTIHARGEKKSETVDIKKGQNNLDIPVVPSRLKISIQPSEGGSE